MDPELTETTRSTPRSSSEGKPSVFEWSHGDQANPYNWPVHRKWLFTSVTASATLSVSFASSGYTGALSQIVEHFDVSRNVAMLGLTLYVVGFAAGPLAWAPLSEAYGRRPIFLTSHLPFTLFCLGSALARNIAALLITRFSAGLFGGCMMVVGGAMVADVWGPKERGLATSIFVLAAFLGPVIAPIAGGFLGNSHLGWRSVPFAMTIFAGVTYVLGILFIPETYGPLLKRRAEEKQTPALSDEASSKKTAGQVLRTSLSRPFILLFTEPIVILLAIWVSFVYGTLYFYFASYPLVFQSDRPLGYGMKPGVGALPFLGIGAGMIVGTCIAFITDKQYIRKMETSDESIPPEARLPPACIGAVCLPISLALFAATSHPSIHWIAPTLAGIPFGIGLVLIFVSVLSYLIDTYGVYCASALAANAVVRSLFAAAFPMFTTKMYEALGYRWATGVLAFFALACLPLPFVFYKYGAAIRRKSRFTAGWQAA